MSESAKTETAFLMNENSAEAVALAEVTIPAFPNRPVLVIWQGRYFQGGDLGYGAAQATYYEVHGYEAT